MDGLGVYVHSKNLTYSIYTAESTETCGGYPGSLGHELLDAQTFADWKVDYIKVCGAPRCTTGRGRLTPRCAPALELRPARPLARVRSTDAAATRTTPP